MTLSLTKVNTKPVVATSNPEIYENHTYHMSKAVSYTYNYAVIDDYILANWQTMTQKAMAKDLNELFTRVQYRYNLLKALGIIGTKNVERTKEYRVKKEYLQLNDTAMSKYKELMAINPQALAG